MVGNGRDEGLEEAVWNNDESRRTRIDWRGTSALTPPGSVPSSDFFVDGLPPDLTDGHHNYPVYEPPPVPPANRIPRHHVSPPMPPLSRKVGPVDPTAESPTAIQMPERTAKYVQGAAPTQIGSASTKRRWFGGRWRAPKN